MSYSEQLFPSENTPEERLLAAVVGLAVKDATLPPVKLEKRGIKLCSEAASALDFLFTPSCEGYLDYLEIDTGSFRKRLLKVMADTSKSDMPFKEIARRNFRINYTIWKEEYARLGGRVSGDEEESFSDTDVDEPETV